MFCLLFFSVGSHTTGWTSQDDVSIQTDPQSELSAASSNIPAPDTRYYPNHYSTDYSFSQVSFPNQKLHEFFN